MPNNKTEQEIQNTLSAIVQLIGSQKLQQSVLDDKVFKTVLQKLNLPLSARPKLLNILNQIEHKTGQTETLNEIRDEGTSYADVEKMLLESFTHIRWSFWISLTMSVILFVVGLLFLGIAIYRSFAETTVSTSTLMIAGIGISDFVLLFYSKPWQDISINLSNSQQVKIIATSYLAGLSLLQNDKQQTFNRLKELAQNSVKMLEQYAEERPRKQKPASD